MAKLICIDSGHGGSDPGATNGGKYEKAVTLAAAKLLKKELEAAGFNVIMTREDDKFLTLAERCIIANREKADIFVSLHCNSAENKDAHGIETWRYTSVGATTKQLAENIQCRLIEATGARDRGVKEGSLYVLKHTRMPAVLAEIGFISNTDESIKLFKTHYQTKIAKAICQGIIDSLK